MHALRELDVPLSAGKRRAIDAGQIGAGLQGVGIRLRGEHEPFVALGGADWPITFAQTEYWDDGDTLVVAFGPDATAIDLTDLAAVQERSSVGWLPEAEVAEIASHDWVADPLARGDMADGAHGLAHRLRWPNCSVLKARSCSRGLDYADGWAGFIDGAIESGLRAARTVERILGGVAATLQR